MPYVYSRIYCTFLIFDDAYYLTIKLGNIFSMFISPEICSIGLLQYYLYVKDIHTPTGVHLNKYIYIIFNTKTSHKLTTCAHSWII